MKNSKLAPRTAPSRFSQYAKDPKKGLTVQELGWPNTPLELWLELSERGPEGRAAKRPENA